MLDENRPGISNLVKLMATCNNTDCESIVQQYHNKGYGAFKHDLAQSIIEVIIPVQNKYLEVRKDQNYLDSIIADGKEKAISTAKSQVDQMLSSIGMIS